MRNEIILYQSDQLTERIEVKIEEETVWLSQRQMATLFQQTKQNISLHINNCFKEGELERNSSVKEYLTLEKEGNRTVKRKIEYYNLDLILTYFRYKVCFLTGKCLMRMSLHQKLSDLPNKILFL